jgi:hypothetical protein
LSEPAEIQEREVLEKQREQEKDKRQGKRGIRRRRTSRRCHA